MRFARSSNTILLAAAGLAAATPIAHAAPAPRVVVDAALEGDGTYAGKVYFFAEDYYVSYDWNNDRVDGGPRPLKAWPLGAPVDKGLDAALSGAAAFAGKGYVFKDRSYLRYDWSREVVDQQPLELSAWKLSGVFGQRIDAALDGRAQFAGFAYFFRDGAYVKYDWKNDRLVGGARTIAAGWHLPGGFARKVDAAVNGSGPFAGRCYFFRNDEYVRYIWAKDAPDGGPEKIVGKWPGLQEMAQAARGSAEARRWIAHAIPLLQQDLAAANANLPSNALLAAALRSHFKITTIAERKARLLAIISTFEAVRGVLENPANIYQFRTPAEAAADGMAPHPAYTLHAHYIRFTEVFAKFGPKAQAAMVLHEGVHYVDAAATAANDFYEHSPAYATITTDQAMHNPSSFASLAGHLFTGSDVKYGAGSPDL